MENVFRAREYRIVGRQGSDVLPGACEIGIALVMRQIAAVPTGEVIDHPHRKPVPQQQIHDVAADEARPTGNHGDWFKAHAALRRFSRRTLK